MDTAWILIGSYLTPRERIFLSRASRKLHSIFSSHTKIPHWCTSSWSLIEKLKRMARLEDIVSSLTGLVIIEGEDQPLEHVWTYALLRDELAANVDASTSLLNYLTQVISPALGEYGKVNVGIEGCVYK